MTAPAFVKPAQQAKVFPAAVYRSGSALAAVCQELADTLPVLIAEPVRWDVEYRCFVLNRHVVAASPYLRAGQLARVSDGSWPMTDQEDEALQAFMEATLADPAVQLPAAVVVDIGIVAGRGWAIVEANEAWASGLYGCNPAAVLPVLRRATVNRQDTASLDRVWMRQSVR